MLATFAHTGGITGAEVGVAAATGFLNQKLLEALFGEAALVEMIGRARASLAAAIDAAFDEELARYERLVPDGAARCRELTSASEPSGCGHPRRAQLQPARSRRPFVGGRGLRAARGRPAPSQPIDALAARQSRRHASSSCDVGRAEAVATEATERLGIAPDAYVLALVGGTGVGQVDPAQRARGDEVSPASARRPTTGSPSPGSRPPLPDEVRPLLARLGVEHTAAPWRRPRPGRDPRPAGRRLAGAGAPGGRRGGPAEARRRRLGRPTPRSTPTPSSTTISCATWMPRLDRQIVVLNKADRLDRGRAPTVTRDLGKRVAHGTCRCSRTSAVEGEAGIAELRRWLGRRPMRRPSSPLGCVAAARAALGALAGVPA